MKHGAVYLGTKDKQMKFTIQSLPISNQTVRLPADECDDLNEKELAERLTTATQGVLQGEEVFVY